MSGKFDVHAEGQLKYCSPQMPLWLKQDKSSFYQEKLRHDCGKH